MTRFLIAVKLNSKASVDRVRLVLDKLARAGDEVHVVHVVIESAAASTRFQKIHQHLETKLKPLFDSHPAISLDVHCLPVSRPFSSYIESNVAKATALCEKAASLSCSVIVVGGSSTKVRDVRPAAFFVGHSTGYWVLQSSRVPIYFSRENRLSMPAEHFSSRLSAAQQAQPTSGNAHLVQALA